MEMTTRSYAPLLDPTSIRDGTNPEIDAAVEGRVQALLDQRVAAAVKEATEPLQAAIDQIARNRDSLLKEKRALEGRAIKEAEERADARPKAIDFAITREQARDPQEYRRARDEAAKHGLPLMILDKDRIERRGEPPETFANDSTLFVYGPKIRGDHIAYQRHKAEAERRGLKLHIATGPEQFPGAAFGGGGQ